MYKALGSFMLTCAQLKFNEAKLIISVDFAMIGAGPHDLTCYVAHSRLEFWLTLFAKVSVKK